MGSSVQGARATHASLATECVEYEHGDVRIKLFTVFGNTEQAAVHGTGGRAQTGSAGVFKGLARFEQGLLPDNAQTFNFFSVAVGVVDIPGPGYDLGRNVAGIGDGDGVGEYVQAFVRRGLVRQELRHDFDSKVVLGHRCNAIRS